MANGQVRLWHLPSSHFSEKVRWALEYKRIGHTRHLPRAVPHFVVARLLTGGETTTFPVLQIGGETIGDSTAIIAELERRWPEPPLYPLDPADRERALAIEDWFDTNLGRDIRVLALGAVTQDPPRLRQLSGRHIPWNFRPFPDVWAKLFATTVTQRYGLDRPGRAEQARAGVVASFDRLERELDGGEYLVGDAFSVADLAAASHFYWLLQPPEGPRIVDRLPEPLAEFMATFEDREGYRWVLEMYRRHRRAVGSADARPLVSQRG
ncbi:MAG TPA: glutathione S-transferase family protein [Solirubrobacteraceae bacterium]|jgi:glutathione S-transferase